jgi:UDP-3-O-[3-hydroxymyristoyl] glucosamine N-acyltransferase
MSEPIFFKRGGGLSVGEIAQLTGAEPGQGARLDRRITDVAQINRAGPSDLVFLDRPQFAQHLPETRAGACLTTDQYAGRAPKHVAVLRTREPYRAFIAVTRTLFPAASRPSSLFECKGIATGATVHETARLENGVTVDPGAVIGPRAEIGSGTIINAGAVIGPGVRIGRDCSIGAGVTVTHALIGDRVILHAGCRIGQDGYAFQRGSKGHEKVLQLGRVIIQDDVEIGANSTVDRGGIRDTVIGEGTKIDNLVQIGHNVLIGRHCLLAAQVGVSGSATIGDFAMLAGQVGVSDHIAIGEGAVVLAQSGVGVDIPAGERWGGYPAMPVRDWLRSYGQLRRMGRGDAADKARGPAKEDK